MTADIQGIDQAQPNAFDRFLRLGQENEFHRGDRFHAGRCVLYNLYTLRRILFHVDHSKLF